MKEVWEFYINHYEIWWAFALNLFKNYKSGLSTLPDNPGVSRFWTVSPGLQNSVGNLQIWAVSFGLQIYVCDLPHNWRSLLFVVDLTFWQGNMKCLALFLDPPPPPPQNLLIWLWCNVSVRRLVVAGRGSHILHIWRRVRLTALINGLRSYMKHSKECVIRFPNSLKKLVKKKNIYFVQHASQCLEIR